MSVRFVKGHGTENDFVVLPDPDDALDLSPAFVRALCDRRAGLGGDGVLRAVRTGDGWFMDYRNADGSLAEMCGNGIRVFARYLVTAGLQPPGAFDVATRAGARRVVAPLVGDVTVDMGLAVLLDEVRVAVGESAWPAVGVCMGNPHAVAFVADLRDAGALREPPVVTPDGSFPDGVNVEFVVGRGPRHIALRVHERGVGETRSCGTGACAAVVAASRGDGAGPGQEWAVDVPGGRLIVRECSDGHVELRGPAVLVATGTLDPGWQEGAGRAAAAGPPQGSH